MKNMPDQRILEQVEISLRKGDLPGAEKLCRSVLASNRDNAEALFLLGNCLFRREDYTGAIDAFSRALRSAPREAPLLLNMALAQREAGRFDDAIATFRMLLKQTPDSAKAHFNLGVALQSKENTAEAIAAFQRTVELDPKHLEAWYRLGILYHGQSMFTEAIAAYRQALAIAPDTPQVHNNLGNSYKYLGLTAEAIASYRRSQELAPQNWEPFSNCLMTMLLTPECSPAEVYDAHRRWAALQADHFLAQAPPHQNSPEPERRLRIGYVSRDFVIHPVAFFIEPILAYHDQTRFQVFCYADVAKPDRVTEQFEKFPVVWRPVYGLSDDDLARQVRADGIDILIDLAGHTMHHRLFVFARKPAPVQVNWLGYAATTGLKAIDYRITDAYADPPGVTEQYHAEQLCRLHGPFICYRPPSNAPEVSPLPLDHNGHCTFAVFNHFSKVTSQAIACWAKILTRVPGSRLLMKAQGLEQESMRRSVLAMFAQVGIPGERLDLIGKTRSVLEHLELFGRVDISLDTFPYNGTTTTCESLWMGVPVITVEGNSHVSRVGFSLLNHLRLPHFIARDQDEYIRLAVELAGNVELLAALRPNLRQIMLNSPLLDPERVTRMVEDAYRQMWREWCSKRS